MNETHAGKRVLIVVNDAAFFLSHRLPVALGARLAGYDVHIATAASPPVAQIRDAGFQVHIIPLGRRSLGPIGELRTLAGLVALYKRLRPDLVHHVTSKPVLYGSIAARMTGVPAVVNALSGLGYVFAATGVLPRVLRIGVAAAYRQALRLPNQHVIVQNADDREMLISRGMASPEDIALIGGSGVDLSVFQPTPESSGLPVVLMPSRMLWEKGVGEFIEAARQLRAEGLHARFVLAGDSDPHNPGEVSTALLHELHDSGLVEWNGHRSDMAQALSEAHIVVLPSYREGFPKVLQEAAAAGRPVITTAVPGCREAVLPERSGILVPARNASALAGAIRRLVERPEERVAMGRTGRALAEARFGVDGVVAATLELYRLLLDRHSRSGHAA